MDDKAHLARMQKEIQSLKEDLKAKEEAKEEIIQLRVADVEKDRLLKDLQEKLLAAKLVIQQNPGRFFALFQIDVCN